MSNEGYLPLDAGYATRAIHACQSPDQWSSRSVATPIFTTSVYKLEDYDFSKVKFLFNFFLKFQQQK